MIRTINKKEAIFFFFKKKSNSDKYIWERESLYLVNVVRWNGCKSNGAHSSTILILTSSLSMFLQKLSVRLIVSGFFLSRNFPVSKKCLFTCHFHKMWWFFSHLNVISTVLMSQTFFFFLCSFQIDSVVVDFGLCSKKNIYIVWTMVEYNRENCAKTVCCLEIFEAIYFLFAFNRDCFLPSLSNKFLPCACDI